ncbi:FAD-dependent oxidoreductase [bacterium]|nr:FAD-dependent oxidoreductase [bacterium]
MHVAIIGNGIAGITAAQRIRARQPDWRITVISGESRHHYSRPALMYVWMGHMRYADTKPYEDGHWERQRIDLVRDWVTRIDTDAGRLVLHRGDPIAYDRLLLATGSKPNRFGWKGQDLEGVQGLYGLMDLQRLRANTERCSRAVIVGGGLIGIELGEMLHTQGIHVTFLVREKSYWGNVLPGEESGMVNRLVRAHGFDLRLETQLAEIVDDGSGRAGAVVTDGGDRIECQLVGLTAGVSPNLDLVRDTPVATGRGVRVDASLRTNVEGVFAAGDCAELATGGDGPGRLEQVWYTGKEQGEVAGDVIAGSERSYEPRIWYNSAKFLDLEYQVYGRVNRAVPGERSLYWEHPDGRHAVRLVHVDGTLIGVNVMGMRYRHLVCEAWIREGRDVEHVMSHLADAHFDPEFFRRHEADIVPALRAAHRGEGREAAA